MNSGDMVEYGASTPNAGDRLGRIVREERRHRQDCYLIAPLSRGPGGGTAPSWYRCTW